MFVYLFVTFRFITMVLWFVLLTLGRLLTIGVDKQWFEACIADFIVVNDLDETNISFITKQRR